MAGASRILNLEDTVWSSPLSGTLFGEMLFTIFLAITADPEVQIGILVLRGSAHRAVV